MFTTIVITVETVLVCILAVFVFKLNKMVCEANKRACLAKMLLIDAFLGIQKGIDKFNEKYDVQLSIDFIKKDDDYTFVTLKFIDPKDEGQPLKGNTTE